MLVTPAATSRSHIRWRGPAGVAMHADAHAVLGHHALQVGDQADHRAGHDLLADPRRVGVHQTDDPEAALGEPGVVGQRLPEVADPDDDHRPVLGQSQLAGDLVDQVVATS